MHRLAAVLVLTVAACGPVSPELAAKQCEERARGAAGPTGSVAVGVNSNGEVSNRFEIGISSDFVAGRDPEAVYRDCVFRKTGQPPIRALNL